MRVAVFGTVMLGIAITDAKTLPHSRWLHGLRPGLRAGDGAVQRPARRVTPFATPWDALIGACAGAGAIAIVGWLGEVVLKKEAMGFGDVTLMAVVGAALGPGRTLLVIFLGAAVGAIAFLFVVYPIVRLRGWSRRRADRVAAGRHESLRCRRFRSVFSLRLPRCWRWFLDRQLLDWYIGQLTGVS